MQPGRGRYSVRFGPERPGPKWSCLDIDLFTSPKVGGWASASGTPKGTGSACAPGARVVELSELVLYSPSAPERNQALSFRGAIAANTPLLTREPLLRRVRRQI